MYIYQNFGYDINEVGDLSALDDDQAEQARPKMVDDTPNDTLNTNRLNHSMQDVEDAFQKLNAFTDAELKQKTQLRLRGGGPRRSRTSLT